MHHLDASGTLLGLSVKENEQQRARDFPCMAISEDGLYIAAGYIGEINDGVCVFDMTSGCEPSAQPLSQKIAQSSVGLCQTL